MKRWGEKHNFRVVFLAWRLPCRERGFKLARKKQGFAINQRAIEQKKSWGVREQCWKEQKEKIHEKRVGGTCAHTGCLAEVCTSVYACSMGGRWGVGEGILFLKPWWQTVYRCSTLSFFLSPFVKPMPCRQRLPTAPSVVAKCPKFISGERQGRRGAKIHQEGGTEEEKETGT